MSYSLDGVHCLPLQSGAESTDAAAAAAASDAAAAVCDVTACLPREQSSRAIYCLSLSDNCQIGV